MLLACGKRAAVAVQKLRWSGMPLGYPHFRNVKVVCFMSEATRNPVPVIASDPPSAESPGDRCENR